MIVLSWLRRYGWLLLFSLIVVFVTIAAFVLRKKPTDGLTMMTAIKTELVGIRAEGELERRLAEKGAAAAAAEVTLAYERQKDALDEIERKEAEDLKENPAKLAGFLARAGARRSSRART